MYYSVSTGGRTSVPAACRVQAANCKIWYYYMVNIYLYIAKIMARQGLNLENRNMIKSTGIIRIIRYLFTRN